MTLPMFSAHESPGPDFAKLLDQMGYASRVIGEGGMPETPHGTTIVATRYADGVIMAGDRRATAGHEIAHRGVEKVFAADRYSGVSISGSVAAALEMVKLFQTNLEHYEKVEGTPLSLEGKANQLEQLVRRNLPAAMQMGMIVVPIFAGYDLRRHVGRIFSYDAAGGRTEEVEFHATGSGGRAARMTLKLGWRANLSRDEAIELSVQSLYEAADEDSATGGPDIVRRIYPVVATITEAGFTFVEDEEVADRFLALIENRTAQGQEP